VTSLVSHDGRVSIDPESGVPAYRQLAMILTGRIASGEITRRLPSENTLMQEYGLALGTVRHAIAVLRDEGVVFTTPGLGTFVAKDAPSSEG
jgi:DNA-binding GntR family transcriptional regulator